jgi:hypothetical protein
MNGDTYRFIFTFGELHISSEGRPENKNGWTARDNGDVIFYKPFECATEDKQWDQWMNDREHVSILVPAKFIVCGIKEKPKVVTD